MNPLDREVLKRFLLGMATDAELAEIERFLENDPASGNILKSLEIDDAFVKELRVSSSGTKTAVDRIGSSLVDELVKRFEKLSVGGFDQTRVDAGVVPRAMPVEPGWIVADRYELLELIGEGGMGLVYRANQTSPVKRHVALKLMKHGMDSQTVLARFDAERQALAMMDHPNIARVYDGGTADSGQPYFVMELVDGIPITEFCDGHRLNLKARLELFITVCQAVQHAHQKGIIHRDLKPGNVLVTRVDGRPTPKVIDFGVAKATEMKLTEQTIADFGVIVGTPAYMSPEQADPSSRDIDTRTDVYALGVILYELLVGSPPFTSKEFDRAAILEMLRVVREVEPSRPSTKVSTAEGLASIAANRNIDPARLPKLLCGDLDWIVLKALEKDRTRRYETANGLAADLQRHLSNEPVIARPPSAAYRLQKAWQRNRIAFTAATVVAATLIVGTGVSLWAAFAADKARESESNQKRAAQDAEKKYQKEAADNLRLANEAEMAGQQANQRLVEIQANIADMQTERGMLAIAEGDFASGMLWFANAATQTPHDQQRQEANRIRARNAWENTMQPVAFLTPKHSDGRRLSFQPHGTLLMSFARESIQLWNWTLEQSLAWADNLMDVTAAHWLPQGSSVAIGYSSGDVEFREVPSGRTIWSHHAKHRIEAIAFSRDGKRMAIGGETVQVWDVSNELTLEFECSISASIRSIAFNRNGNRLVVGCSDNRARVFSTEANRSRQPLFPAIPHVSEVEPPVFINDGRELITLAESNRVGWWNAETGEDAAPPTSNLRLNAGTSRLRATEDGLWFAVGGRPMALWNTTGERFTPPHINEVYSVAFSPDGKGLATGCGDWKARLWSLDSTLKPFAAVPQLENVGGCEYSDDGNYLAVNSEGHIRVWRTPNSSVFVGQLESSNQIGQGTWRYRPSPDGRWMTPTPWRESSFGPFGPKPSITVAEAGSGRAAGPPITLPRIMDSTICSDNASVAIISAEGAAGKLSIFDVTTGQQLLAPIDLPAVPESVASRPGHSELAVMCQNGHVAVFDRRNGIQRHQITRALPTLGRKSPRVEYSPDGKRLIAQMPSGSIEVFDAETGSAPYSPLLPVSSSRMDSPQPGFCRSIAFSPDSRWLATVVNRLSSNEVRVWDLTTGSPANERQFEPGSWEGTYVARFSPDSHRLLTSNKDGRVRIYDWKSGQLSCPPLQHTDEVFDATFSQDGQWIYTTMYHGTLRIWETTTGKPITGPIKIEPQSEGNDYTFSLVGDLAVVSGKSWSVFNTRPLIEPSRYSTESLLRIAELASGRHLELGEMSGLSGVQWSKLWQDLKSRELSPRAIAESLAREFETVSDVSSRLLIAERAVKTELTMDYLLSRFPDSPELNYVAARYYEPLQKSRSDEYLAKAAEAYQSLLERNQLDELGADQLAKILLSQTPSTWQVLEANEATSEFGANLTRLDDGAYLVEGNDRLGDTYSLKGIRWTGKLAAIKLEALPHSQLPLRGPGRHTSGNFQLGSFLADRQSSHDLERLPFSKAWASYTYPRESVNVQGTIDETRNQIWHVFGRPGETHTAIFELTDEAEFADDQTLTIALKHYPRAAQPVNLGCFRLSGTRKRSSLFDPTRISSSQRIGSSGWIMLAFAMFERGDVKRARKILEQSERFRSVLDQGIRLLLLIDLSQRDGRTVETRQLFEQLTKWYQRHSVPPMLEDPVQDVMVTIGGFNRTQAIAQLKQQSVEREIAELAKVPAESTDFEVIAKRMRLYASLGNWKLAATDAETLFRLVPTESVLGLQCATFYAISADRDGHRAFVQEFARRFSNPPTSFAADHLIKGVLLFEEAYPIENLPVKLLREQNSATQGGYKDFFVVTRALLAYRAHRFEEALSLSQSIAEAQPDYLAVYALSVRSLALNKLGQHEKAREAYDDARSKIPRSLRNASMENNSSSLPIASEHIVFDWLIAEVMCREADSLFAGSAPEN